MGAVFRARHLALRKDVAVKVLRPELSQAPDLVERFRREAEIASLLEHDNIVRVTDVGRSEGGLLYLTMDLLAGESLFERLRRERALPPSQAVTLLWQICAGLEAAHDAGVVHRDLKPENVFLARTPGGREVVKLLDFGIAKFARGSGEGTQAGVVVGTPEYLSPEQAMGLPVDARADLYAVGLIAFRMLAGHHPFKADDARGLLLLQASRPVPPLAEASPELGAWAALCQAVAAACEKDPARRPPTAAALGHLFAASLGPAFVAPPGATPVLYPTATGPGASTRRLTPAGPGPRPRARPARRWLLLAGGLALLAAVALSAAGVRTWRARPVAQARRLLVAGQPGEALAAIDAALRAGALEPELRGLRARALCRLPGRAGEALETFAAAQAGGALRAEDYQDLVALLGEDRSVADRAARLLRDASPAAVPLLAAAARAGPPSRRLRAMAVLRDLGAEDAVERVSVYGALLAEPDCDTRRAAARRLGELGDPAALPALRLAAAAGKSEKRWLFAPAVRIPACGAPEASEALRRIQSMN
jgi:serine/threonine-protein kinase